METPPRTQMASYLERWEEQKAQSRRLRQLRRRSSDVGEELSFISAIERENAADSFDLPAVDAFPASETRQNIPMDDEFVDAGAWAGIRRNRGLRDIDTSCVACMKPLSLRRTSWVEMIAFPRMWVI